ncbi:SAVMC3_10250 family protein [Kribbella lupini]|uniref:Uncharacterized protein n=1 Tax=Kribbella lupini TaxID=291602 RepID=A0ABN2A8L0_9ACTN
MRELVYLSQAKLQQFRKPTSKRDGLSGGVKLTAGLTGLPSVEANVDYDPVAAAAGTAATLDQAEEFIRSKWPVRWWTEELEPGEWMQFETWLVSAVLKDGIRQVVFWWGRHHFSDGSSVQLLLHGSPQHLLQSSGDQLPREAISGSAVAGLFSYLATAEEDGTDTSDAQWYEAQLDRLVRQLRGIAPEVTATWVSGMARVSFSVEDARRRMVVASPLVVEYVPVPR